MKALTLPQLFAATAAALIFAFACVSMARPVKLAWDTPPSNQLVVGWRIWSGSTLLGASSTPTATVQIPNAATTLTVTAINAAGESAHSEPLTIPPPLMWIQKSTDLQTWINVVQMPYEPRQFIRLETPTP